MLLKPIKNQKGIVLVSIAIQIASHRYGLLSLWLRTGNEVLPDPPRSCIFPNSDSYSAAVPSTAARVRGEHCAYCDESRGVALGVPGCIIVLCSCSIATGGNHLYTHVYCLVSPCIDNVGVADPPADPPK